MGSARQLLNLYVEEAYRYRLAMHVQQARVELAKQELRQKAESEVMARIFGDDWGEKARAMNEAQFFFVAVRGILGAATSMKEVASGGAFPTVRSVVTEAIDKFDREAPHALDMRDFLIHMDAYLAGRGHKELPHPEHRVWLATPEEDFGLYVGGVAISISKTAAAAECLAGDLTSALSQLEVTERNAHRNDSLDDGPNDPGPDTYPSKRSMISAA